MYDGPCSIVLWPLASTSFNSSVSSHSAYVCIIHSVGKVHTGHRPGQQYVYIQIYLQLIHILFIYNTYIHGIVSKHCLTWGHVPAVEYLPTLLVTRQILHYLLAEFYRIIKILCLNEYTWLLCEKVLLCKCNI